jgi:hypothetical protein
LLFVSTLTAAPLPKLPEVPLYYPIEVGTKRVIEHSYSGGILGTSSREIVETVTKVEQREKKHLVTVSLDRPASKILELMYPFVYEVSHQGILMVRKSDRDLSEPEMILQLPLKIGNSWEGVDFTFKVEKEEEVEVPAGRFKTIVIVGQRNKGEKTLWFAPKVGCVKSIYKSPLGETITVLKSFTPGKK